MDNSKSARKLKLAYAKHNNDFQETSCNRLVAKTRVVWNTLGIALAYYASMRMIFYTELALIMLCLVDLSINFTALIILITMSSSDAHRYAVWAVADARKSHQTHKHFCDQLFALVQALYLAESVNRIYYCLMLAYQHDKKMKEGDLCCVKCHQPLISASMPPVFALPHFISALANIVYFVVAYRGTAIEIMEQYKMYFADSPFVNRVNSSALKTSMYYAMATGMLTNDIATCRLGKNESIDSTVRHLLNTGSVDSVVDYRCAVSVVHCKYARFYLQLAIESVLALLNYTVIRTLFSHVINMHEYEVYNQQTRLQANGSSRIIRVYKLHQRKTRPSLFSSGFAQLPRQALMSLINLGSNLSAKIRRSGKLDAHGSISEFDVVQEQQQQQQQFKMSIQVEPTAIPTDEMERQLLNTADTESNEAGTWLDEKDYPIVKSPDVGLKPAAELTESELATRMATAEQQASQSKEQQQSSAKVFNRKEFLKAKKVNFQHLRVSNLFPLVEDAASSPPAKTDQLHVVGAAAGDARTPSQTADAMTAPSLNNTDSASDSSKDLIVSKFPLKGKKMNENDTIFTDETFYSLDT